MAWSNIRNYGLLDRWKTRMGQQPYQFQQMNDGYADYSPEVWIQRERDELANALINEINRFNFWLGYNPLPLYHEEVIHFNTSKAWYNQTLKTGESSRLIEFGQENTEKLGTANVTYSGDKATITFTNSLITDGKVAVLFNSTDTEDVEGNLKYKIFDLSVSHDGTDYTFIGHKSLFVKPRLQNELDSFVNGNPRNRNKLDINDSNNFASSVDIYRVYTDTSIQAELLSVDYTNNTTTATAITPIIQNGEFGEFSLSTVDSSEINIYDPPFAVKIYYKAGKALESTGNMFMPFETVLVRQARANLPIPTDIVSYRTGNQWEQDEKSITSSPDAQAFVNPIGAKMIDYYTWQVFQTYHDKTYGEAQRFV